MPFVKGQPKPPTSGRRRGTPNRVRRVGRIPKVPKSEDERIIDDVIRKARKGDIEATKLYLRFLRTRSQVFLGPYAFVPPANPEEARAAILALAAQLAAGKISLELHDALIGDLKVYLGAITMDKLGLTGKSFVVVENNLNSELPLPENDASLAGETVSAASPVMADPSPTMATDATMAALKRALDATPDAVAQPELPFNVLAFTPPDAA
jgi:hypothetical protein